MKLTRVVNKYHGSPFQVNIMRPSKWGNPFQIGKDGTREEVIAKYREYLRYRLDLLSQIHELRGKVLRCCCRPRGGFRGRLMCHGQILAGIADARKPEEVS